MPFWDAQEEFKVIITGIPGDEILHRVIGGRKMGRVGFRRWEGSAL